jgi:Transposase
VIFSGRFILCRLNQFGLIQFEVRSGPRVLAQDKDQSRKRNRFSEEQIIGILKEHEAGVSVADLCREHGVSDASKKAPRPLPSLPPPNRANPTAGANSGLDKTWGQGHANQTTLLPE